VSLTGIGFDSQSAAPLGQWLALGFTLSPYAHQWLVAGQLRRCNTTPNGHRWGIEFGPMENMSEQRLQRLLLSEQRMTRQRA
jgi:hypothetical protein